jgi:uncharacterized protein involved in response to NO
MATLAAPACTTGNLPIAEVAPGRFVARSMKAYAIVGLSFMLLPGTFLGVWNLISISGQHGASSLDAAWIQAHGHAQIFGWISTFILGIGFYSLPQSRRFRVFSIDAGSITLALWTAGNVLRWLANVYWFQWRIVLPLSAFLELAAFLLFFRAVAGHRRPAGTEGPRFENWALLVVIGTAGMLATLLANLGMALVVAARGISPAFPAGFDQPLLIIATWGYLVLFVFGFSARWLPIFLGLRETSGRTLLWVVALLLFAVIAGVAGFAMTFAIATALASVLALLALKLPLPAVKPAKIRGVHPSLPIFVRLAYAWCLMAALLQVWAVLADRHRGIWGASRHALTVGFIAVMVFAVGQRILPHFAGMKSLFSPGLMLATLLLLNAGCTARVLSQIVAYEGFGRWAWSVLPASAVVELCAVTLFAVNIGLTFAFGDAVGSPEPRSADQSQRIAGRA